MVTTRLPPVEEQLMPIGSMTLAAVGMKTVTMMVLTFALMESLIAAVVTTQVNPDSSIWSDTELRLVCIIGAIAGATISCVIPWPNDDLWTGHTEVRKFAWKLVSRHMIGSVSGIMTTPLVMSTILVSKTVDMVLGYSFLVAFVSYASLVLVASNWATIGPWFVARWTSKDKT